MSQIGSASFVVTSFSAVRQRHKPDMKRCKTATLPADLGTQQWIVRMSFLFLSCWLTCKQVPGAQLFAAVAMSSVLASIFDAVQSNQPPRCPCQIVHPGLVKPTYVNGPLILMYPQAVWQFSAALVKGLTFSHVTLVCQTPFHRNRSLMLLIVSGDVELNPGPTGSSSSIADAPNGNASQSTQSIDCQLFTEHAPAVMRCMFGKRCKRCGFVLLRHVGGPTGTTAIAGLMCPCLGKGPQGQLQLLEYIMCPCLGTGPQGQLQLLEYILCPSGDRPTGTTAAAGFNASMSGDRSTGTTAAAGFNVSMSGDRPTGTTAAAGFYVSMSGGRPTGTTAAAGFYVSMSGSRPTGTTVARGYTAGLGGGWPSGAAVQGEVKHEKCVKTHMAFANEEDEKMVNVSAAKLKRLENRIIKECKFDSTLLGKAVCWK